MKRFRIEYIVPYNPNDYWHLLDVEPWRDFEAESKEAAIEYFRETAVGPELNFEGAEVMDMSYLEKSNFRAVEIE